MELPDELTVDDTVLVAFLPRARDPQPAAQIEVTVTDVRWKEPR
jgi:hypothetical protein